MTHPQLGGLGLDLALADVLEELRRAQDRVDERAEEGDEADDGGGRHEDRVADPAPGVGEGPVGQRQP